MFYAVLIVAVLGWLAVGVIYAGNVIVRQKLSDAYMQINELGQANIQLKDDLECTDDALAYETRIATEMQEERDSALKCLELVINEASTEELTR